MKSKQALLSIGLLGGSIMAIMWTFQYMQSSQSAAETAAENVTVCQQLIQKITQLREQPAKAALSVRQTSELSQGIEQAAQFAEFSDQAITRIDPQPPRRIGDSQYTAQSTNLEMRGITLHQLISFLVTLSNEETGLQVTSLRLSAPRHDSNQQQSPETWGAEVTLTYLVFSPKVPSS